ncbi:MAG: aminopeptidase, partial [Bacteroidaceae bacterium]|nr:aminopeptidase [Bacteroidaceae bacterium]
MKKLIVFAAVAMLVLPVAAKSKKKEAPKDSLIFTTVVENPVTSIKNQNSSGTCWAYSSLAFLESEVIKKHP